MLAWELHVFSSLITLINIAISTSFLNILSYWKYDVININMCNNKVSQSNFTISKLTTCYVCNSFGTNLFNCITLWQNHFINKHSITPARIFCKKWQSKCVGLQMPLWRRNTRYTLISIVPGGLRATLSCIYSINQLAINIWYLSTMYA